MEALTPSVDYRVIPGWTDFEKLYERAVSEVPDGGVLVEVGSWLGRSAALMCSLLERAGKKGRVRFYCVDTWLGSPHEPEHQTFVAGLEGDLFSQFQKNMTPWRGGYYTLPMPSVEAASLFDDGAVDFVFLDADHTTPAVLADIAAWKPKVTSGGLLAGHDIDWASVREAVTAALPVVEIQDRCWLHRVP